MANTFCEAALVGLALISKSSNFAITFYLDERQTCYAKDTASYGRVLTGHHC